jgi:hypothetical protein
VEALTESIFAIAMALPVPKSKYPDLQRPAGASGLLRKIEREDAGCGPAYRS